MRTVVIRFILCLWRIICQRHKMQRITTVLTIYLLYIEIEYLLSEIYFLREEIRKTYISKTHANKKDTPGTDEH